MVLASRWMVPSTVGTICWLMVYTHTKIVFFKSHMNIKMKSESTLPKNKRLGEKRWRELLESSRLVAIIQNPGKQWKIATLDNIIKACIIMHNMIGRWATLWPPTLIRPWVHAMFLQGNTYWKFVQGTAKIEDVDTDYSLCGKLIEHHWDWRGIIREDNEHWTWNHQFPRVAY